MKESTRQLIKTLIDDDITNASARIRALNSELYRIEEYQNINPDADYTQEINEIEYSKAYWENLLDRSEDALKDFNNALKS